MSIDGKHMGVTGNAVLLLGYIAGALVRCADDEGSRSRAAFYELVDADAATGMQIVQHSLTLNTYRIAVVQLTGTA